MRAASRTGLDATPSFLRAALDACAESITEPTGSVDYHPPTISKVRSGRRNTRAGHPGRWMGPALAATAVILLAVGAAAIIQTVNSRHGQPLSPSREPTNAPSPSAAPTNAPSPSAAP